MAVAQFYAWDRDGRPLDPARPIREFVERLRVAFPKAAQANLFSWYADDAHYQANTPEDHTPYSYTGWPLVNPYPYVFATDVMHRPDLGVDCGALFAYWIGEARAGRMPWLKYLIWQARVYSVRNGWSPVLNSGHHDHIHASARTDHLNTSLGAWSVTPGGSTSEERMFTIVRKISDKTLWLCDTMTARQINSDAELADLRYIAKQGGARLWNGGQIWEGLVPAWGLPIDASGQPVQVDYDRIKRDVRDAVADLGEGGATQVRAE